MDMRRYGNKRNDYCHNRMVEHSAKWYLYELPVELVRYIDDFIPMGIGGLKNSDGFHVPARVGEQPLEIHLCKRFVGNEWKWNCAGVRELGKDTIPEQFGNIDGCMYYSYLLGKY